MVKHSRRNIKHKKNSSRRNIKLKNPKHRKKRATSFRKKPFNLRRSTLKKRQHGGATLADLQALYNSLPANNNNPRNWTPQNNPFNNMSLITFQQFKDEVNRILTEQTQPGLQHIDHFLGQRRRRLINIKTFIDNNEAAIRANIAQQAPAPANQGQVGPVAAIAAAGNLGQQPAPANAQPQGQQPQGLAPAPGLGQQGGPAPGLGQAQQQPAPALAPAPGQIGPVAAIAAAGNLGQQPAPANALVANQVQAVNPGPAAVGQQQQGAPIVPANAPAVNPAAGANQGPAAVNPGPAAAAGLPQTITINITTPPNTIRDLGGDAQLNQNNLAQVDISLAQLVQDFAR